MQCVKCASNIPSEARFCPACGHRFFAPLDAKNEDPSEKETLVFSTAHVEKARTAALAKVSQGGKAQEPKVPAFEEKSSSTESSFTLVEQDFAKALQRAAEEASQQVPEHLIVNDPISLQYAGEELGLDKLKVQQALHRISMEKLPENVRKKMGVVLDDEIVPQGRRWWILLVAILSMGSLSLAGWAFFRPALARPQVQMQAQKGEIDLEKLNLSLDALSKKNQVCYQQSLKKDASLKGEVLLTLRISLEGKAVVRIGQSSLAGQKKNVEDAATLAKECMREAAEKTDWPKAQKAPVDVDIPFVFAPSS